MSISVLLDENISPEVCVYLRSVRAEWNVLHIRDAGLRGAADTAIFNWAQAHGCIVITFDEDFADARMYPAGTHAGVVRLRVWPTTVENTVSALARLLALNRDDELAGALTIIDDNRIRIRKLARHG